MLRRRGVRRADMTPPPFDITHDAVRSSRRTAPGWTTITTVAVLAATLALATTRVTAWHTWGDDFAGYLLQAKALAEGTARDEVTLNGQLVDSSDRRVGPDGYPWGVPALLALAARVVGWDVNGLKVLGLVSFAVLAVLHLQLLRQLRLPPAGIAACAAAVLWQAPLLGELDIIGSDLPFLAASAVYLSLMVAALQRYDHSRALPARLVGLAAFVAAASFAIRSNGVILIGATILMTAYCLIGSYTFTRRQLLLALLAFGGAAAAGFAVFFTLLPDGTSIHLAYLTPEPGRYSRRVQEVVGDLTHFAPIAWLPDALDHLVVLALVPLAGAGVWAMGSTGVLLGLTLFAHTLLLVLFPMSDGLRYYLPLLPPLVLLCWFGTGALAAAAARRWPALAAVDRRAGAILAGAFAGAALLTALSYAPPTWTRAHGPLSPSFAELTGAVTRTVGPSQRLSFFRPRAMRWFTSRQALAVTKAEHLDRVDAVALYKHLEPDVAPFLQPDETAVAGSGQFALVFENADFRLYARNSPGRPRRE